MFDERRTSAKGRAGARAGWGIEGVWSGAGGPRLPQSRPLRRRGGGGDGRPIVGAGADPGGRVSGRGRLASRPNQRGKEGPPLFHFGMRPPGRGRIGAVYSLSVRTRQAFRSLLLPSSILSPFRRTPRWRLRY